MRRRLVLGLQVKAAIVTFGNLGQEYDGTPKTVSVTATPPGARGRFRLIFPHLRMCFRGS